MVKERGGNHYAIFGLLPLLIDSPITTATLNASYRLPELTIFLDSKFQNENRDMAQVMKLGFIADVAILAYERGIGMPESMRKQLSKIKKTTDAFFRDKSDPKQIPNKLSFQAAMRSLSLYAKVSLFTDQKGFNLNQIDFQQLYEEQLAILKGNTSRDILIQNEGIVQTPITDQMEGILRKLK